MNYPVKCHFWQKEKMLCREYYDSRKFEHIKTYEDSSHFVRNLFRCTDCGQLYFDEFLEFVDFESGIDTQYSNIFPVTTIEEADEMSKESPLELLKYTPRLINSSSETYYTWIGYKESPDLDEK